jgi:hypothetical protein
VAEKPYTFLTGGWWFAQGSQEIMGWTSCGDLRLNADQGLGAPGMPGVCLACDRLIAELSDSLLSV